MRWSNKWYYVDLFSSRESIEWQHEWHPLLNSYSRGRKTTRKPLYFSSSLIRYYNFHENTDPCRLQLFRVFYIFNIIIGEKANTFYLACTLIYLSFHFDWLNQAIRNMLLSNTTTQKFSYFIKVFLNDSFFKEFGM